MSGYFSLNIKGELRDFFGPAVMGVINVTPDSFYCNSRNESEAEMLATAAAMLDSGAAILDVGGCSTRPGSTPAAEGEEMERVVPAIKALRREFPCAIISIDTFRGSVARKAVAAGADIINDISAGTIDPDIMHAAVELKVPYILTHPAKSSLHAETPLEETTATVLRDMQRVLRRLRLQGLCDIIVDPGFGFGKTLHQNYQLMADIDIFATLDAPVLVGISRKSMVNKLLDVTPDSNGSLIGTTALNSYALLHGADIIRVHDVKAACDTVKIIKEITNLESVRAITRSHGLKH